MVGSITPTRVTAERHAVLVRRTQQVLHEWAVKYLDLALMFPATRASADLDRLLGKLFAQLGGAVGTITFFAPLLLAILALVLVHLARRLDPTVSWSRAVAPTVLWCLGLGAVWLTTP